MKILVADDHHVVRAGIKMSISGLCADIEFVEAVDSDEVQALMSKQNDFDLALVDMHMPGADTFKLLSKLNKDFNATPIIIISADERPQLITKSIDLGASGFIPKSTSPEAMLEAIRYVLKGGTYVPKLEESSTTPPESIMSDETLPEVTPRQLAVLKLVVEGKSNKEIAQILHVSSDTVKTHMTAILKAYKASNRTQVAIAAASLFKDSEIRN